MLLKRNLAFNKALEQKLLKPETYNITSKLFGENVFTIEKILTLLPAENSEVLKKEISLGKGISKNTAKVVADVIQKWGLENNITHFTHWFQPLRGDTAEKSDCFYDYCLLTKKNISKMSGEQLVKQETDGSSFPNGGLRNTFEARGYTVWDHNSPVFIFNNCLCIPTFFLSYNEEALDFKTPLVKSIKALKEHATETAKFFDENIESVTSVLGWEQEFFIIDRSSYLSRDDIIAVGRTVLGKPFYKSQEMSDHYFGKIPSRVLEYMREVEYEGFKLGIPIKTRHSEVAMNQFEFAYCFEETNLSIDHNTLFMNLMHLVAKKHGLSVLFDEKPFKGVNGSGKHSNFSLMTNTGLNLYDPKQKTLFEIFVGCTINAVYNYKELLTTSVCNLSNDHRLGGHEAPPNILSVFLGEDLTNKLFGAEKSTEEKKMCSMAELSNVSIDTTDRNRTSPFAFVGNRFEYRAVGSSVNCSKSMTILNIALAKSFKEFNILVKKFKEEGQTTEKAAMKAQILILKESKNIIFNGNNYSEEWRKEAVERGLCVIKNAAESFKHFASEKTIKLFKEMNVLTETELFARAEINYDEYVKELYLEKDVFLEMTKLEIIPAVEKRLYDLKKVSSMVKTEKNILETKYEKLLEKYENFYEMDSELEVLVESAKGYKTPKENAEYCSETFTELMEKMRAIVEYFESELPDNEWPILKYKEILNLKLD